MMIIALVEYINKNGRIAVKGFGSESDLNKFTQRLEARGVEYILTKM